MFASNQDALECPRVLPSLSPFALVLASSSQEKDKNNFYIFSFLLHSCSLQISLQEHIWSGTTAPQERFSGADSPTRTILWRVITHKDDFCERQPSPTRTTNLLDD
jgi:hypothetical protein